MKKTAVLIYNSFCNFEFSVALEILALAEKEVVIFAHTKEAVKSEDGLMVLPNQTISEINIDEYDSLILPGAMDIREAIENEEVIEFIRKFENKAIGAISIAPLMLVKAGLLSGKPFMAGVNKEEIMEEGFTEQDLEKMVGWDANLESPVKEGYIITDNIITSISYNFVKWGLAFGLNDWNRYPTRNLWNLIRGKFNLTEGAISSLSKTAACPAVSFTAGQALSSYTVCFPGARVNLRPSGRVTSAVRLAGISNS